MDVSIADVLVGSVIMPPVIALLNQRSWPAQLKGIVALVACFVAAIISEIVSNGPSSFVDWRNTAITVAGAAFAAYKLWWQPSRIAPTIEAVTSVNDAGTRDV